MNLYPQLYDWQKKIVDFAATKKSYGLFLDCGLGKTIQALALAEVVGAEKIVVITKKSKVLETVKTPGSWQYWGSQIEDIDIVDRKAPVFDEHKRQLWVTNYEALFDRGEKSKSSGVSLRKDVKEFLSTCRHKRVTLVLDESHCIKDPSSTQAKALLQLKRELACRSTDLHTYLLTGTPFTTGFIDVWNQLKFLGCPMTKTEFKDRFCELGHIKGLLGWQQPIVGYKNVSGLYALVHEYAITMKSEEVVKLPPQVFVTEFSPRSLLFDSLTRERLTEELVGALNRVRGKLSLPTLPPDYKFYHVSKTAVLNPWCRNIDYPETRWVADTPALLWLRARQLSIGFQGNDECYQWYDKTRFDRIERYLDDHPGNYVLFYNFTPEFYELFERCERLGYHIDVYNGPIKSLYWYEKYSAQSETARMVNKKNVILANFASGSTGMNWQLYDRCLITSLPLYKDWAQGLKRIHRVGSEDTVTYTVFMGDNWLDRGMWKALQEGTEYSQAMFDTDWNSVQLS